MNLSYKFQTKNRARFFLPLERIKRPDILTIDIPSAPTSNDSSTAPNYLDTFHPDAKKRTSKILRLSCINRGSFRLRTDNPIKKGTRLTRERSPLPPLSTSLPVISAESHADRLSNERLYLNSSDDPP